MASNIRIGTESTPLIHPPHPYHNDRDPFNGQNSKLKRFLKFLSIFILLVVILLYIHRPKEIVDKKPYPPDVDIGDLKEHRLIWKGAQSFDYYLKLSHSMIFTDESEGSNRTSGIEFVARNEPTSSERKERMTEEKFKKLRKEQRFDEGVEIYYDIFIKFYESFRVLSATSSVNGEWKSSNITLINYESNDVNSEKYNEICEFKINWSDDLEGVILKRNVDLAREETNLNENSYNVVAYVKGSIDYGFMFYENEDGSGKLFAKTNQTEIGWKMEQ
ncbi:13412_t:CDS:1, partial [Acaulospora colombiana]